jgi:hypothetical protein
VAINKQQAELDQPRRWNAASPRTITTRGTSPPMSRRRRKKPQGRSKSMPRIKTETSTPTETAGKPCTVVSLVGLPRPPGYSPSRLFSRGVFRLDEQKHTDSRIPCGARQVMQPPPDLYQDKGVATRCASVPLIGIILALYTREGGPLLFGEQR